MIIDVKVPPLSESVSEGTLQTWHKKIGDSVKQDESLVDIETDKVVLEIPAPDSGLLTNIVCNIGSVVKPGDLLAKIDTEAKTVSDIEIKHYPESSTSTTHQKVSSSSSSADLLIMPAAKRLMEENAILPTVAIGAIVGSGRGGRITKEDVQNYLNQLSTDAKPSVVSTRTDSPNTEGTRSQATAPTALSQPSNPVDIDDIIAERPEQRVPMTRLRARIAERLVHSQSTAAILTTFNEVNMAPIMLLRNKYKEQFIKNHGVKLGFMSFFVKAAVYALKRFPLVNASIDGQDIVYHGYFDVGIAVGSPRGLVVPILRNADQMSLAQIEKTIADFGQRANEGKLSIEELTGGTFTISNGGVFGSMLSTPIINPPQSAILGIHATKERPVVEEGQMVIRPMNYLALSYDHRIIDGREAVLTLVAIKDVLEDPSRLLLEI